MWTTIAYNNSFIYSSFEDYGCLVFGLISVIYFRFT